MSLASLRVSPESGVSLVVTVTRANGAAPDAYSDGLFATAVTFPQTISSDALYFFKGSADLVVSAKLNGVEIASGSGTTASVYLVDGTQAVVTPRLDFAEIPSYENATFLTIVDHGSTAGTARPVGAVRVEWRGTVTPSNAAVGDLYVNISAPAAPTESICTSIGPVVFAALGGGGASSVTVPDWAPATVYVQYQVVRQAGALWRANTGFTSGATFSYTNWTRVSTPSSLATSSLPNFTRKILASPTAAKILVLGDSTSLEANFPTLYSRLRLFHTAPGEILDGMTADASHVIQGGSNGYTASGWLAQIGAGSGSPPTNYFPQDVLNDAPDLVVVSFGINDVRLGGTTLAQLTSYLMGIVEFILTNLPTTDVILRMPNFLATNDLGGSHYVKADVASTFAANASISATTFTSNHYLSAGTYVLGTGGGAETVTVSGSSGAAAPFTVTTSALTKAHSTGDPIAGSQITNPAGGVVIGGVNQGALASAAQVGTDLMRNAYQSLRGYWPNVVVYDAQQDLFGRTALATTGSVLMTDQLHPSVVGFPLIADGVANTIATHLGKHRLYVAGRAEDAYRSAPTTPWTNFGPAVEDPDYFTLIASGELLVGSPLTDGPGGLCAFKWPAQQATDIVAGDLVELPDGVVFAGAGVPSSYATGDPLFPFAVRFTGLPAGWCGASNVGRSFGTLRVWRKNPGASDPQMRSGAKAKQNRYVRRFQIQSFAAPYMTVGTLLPGDQAANVAEWDTANDKVWIEGYGSNPITMSAITIIRQNPNVLMQLSGAPDMSAYVGRELHVIGTHAPEQQTRISVTVDPGSIAANSYLDVTGIAVAGVEVGYMVIAAPPSSLNAGISWSVFASGVGTVTLRLVNSTTGAIDPSSGTWFFKVVR